VKVAVLAGGRSSEHDVSQESAAAVGAGLAAGGHEVVAVEVGRDGVWRSEEAELVLRPGRGLLDCDVVFPALHGPFGEDGTVQGLLECLDVPYVGAGVLSSALCMDKVLFKDLMAASGIPQVDYVGIEEQRWREDRDAALKEAAVLGLPSFVKPARLGSSVGISKAWGTSDLSGALDAAFEHDSLAIVEALCAGMEVECSVMGTTEPVASQPGEITYSNEWYDYDAKYTEGGMELVVPARLDEPVRERVRALAMAVFKRTGCSGLARVDFFVADGDRVLVNELNTMPGFTATSVYAKLFEASGVPYSELLDRLCGFALERHAAGRAHRF
jgi:D-alanine-D-alanine ligase